MACAPSEDSDQPGYPLSLIRVFAVRMKKHWVHNYSLSAERRLWSDWADAQADLSLCWAHMSFCWFCHIYLYFNKLVHMLLFWTCWCRKPIVLKYNSTHAWELKCMSNAELGRLVRCTADWYSGGSWFDPPSGNILAWRLVMKSFLRTEWPYRWFKQGGCQLLEKGCSLSSG